MFFLEIMDRNCYILPKLIYIESIKIKDYRYMIHIKNAIIIQVMPKI